MMCGRLSFLIPALLFSVLNIKAQVLVTDTPQQQSEEDARWIPTGEWPFLNRRFLPGEVVTGMFTKHKTIVPCNIHVAKQTLWYVQNDTLMEALPGSVAMVTFKNGDVFIPITSSKFGKLVHEDSIGKVVRVREIDADKLHEESNDASRMANFNLSGNFGSLNIDLSSQYNGNPEANPLPVTDTYYFIYKLEIFPVTDKEILKRINPQRRKEYRAFTRSAEILTHNESSVMKIWNNFFARY